MAIAKKVTVSDTPEAMFQATVEPIVTMQEKLRESAEKGMEQARVHYETVKEAAEKATGKIEESLNAAQTGVRAFNLKAFDLVRANTNVAFDHVQSLFTAKTVAEFVTLQNDFLKARAEAFTAQAKELAELGQKLAADAVEPVKSAIVLPFQK